MITGRTFVPQADGTVTYQGTCPFCQRESEVSGLSPDAVTRFDDGRGDFIQSAFPFLSADDRETILSGAHGTCFDQAFPDDEE